MSISCHLYKRDPAQRLWRSLENAGIDQDSPCLVEDLLPFDQMHYDGTHAVDQVAAKLGEKIKGRRLLDVGGGFGGPARYLSSRYGCQVTVVEVQKELADVCQTLNHKTNQPIRVLNKDFLSLECDDKYDYLVSFLVFLHIPDKKQIWQRAFALLTEGGRFSVEDYYLKKTPSSRQAAFLRDLVGVHGLQTKENYLRTVKESGFVDLDCKDMSERWTQSTRQRLEGFVANQEKYLGVHGREDTEHMLSFYQFVSEQFREGVLGGLRLSGTKITN